MLPPSIYITSSLSLSACLLLFLSLRRWVSAASCVFGPLVPPTPHPPSSLHPFSPSLISPADLAPSPQPSPLLSSPPLPSPPFHVTAGTPLSPRLLITVSLQIWHTRTPLHQNQATATTLRPHSNAAERWPRPASVNICFYLCGLLQLLAIVRS